LFNGLRFDVCTIDGRLSFSILISFAPLGSPHGRCTPLFPSGRPCPPGPPNRTMCFHFNLYRSTALFCFFFLSSDKLPTLTFEISTLVTFFFLKKCFPRSPLSSPQSRAGIPGCDRVTLSFFRPLFFKKEFFSFFFL